MGDMNETFNQLLASIGDGELARAARELPDGVLAAAARSVPELRDAILAPRLRDMFSVRPKRRADIASRALAVVRAHNGARCSYIAREIGRNCGQVHCILKRLVKSGDVRKSGLDYFATGGEALNA